MRKILGMAAGAGMLLAMAVPAFATFGGFDWGWQKPVVTEVSISNDNTNVNSNVVAVAETGNNEQEMKAEGTNSEPVLTFGFWPREDKSGTSVEGAYQDMTTGDAQAFADLTVKVNKTVWDVNCECFKNLGGVSISNDNTNVNNDVKAIAKTGDNEQEIKVFGANAKVKDVGQTLKTGSAFAYPTIISWVNWTKIK